MEHFSKSQLSEVDVYLGESNEQIREAMSSAMRDAGFRRMRIFARVEELITAIKEAPPDLLIVSDDMGAALFDVIREIRHFEIGHNPFMTICLLMDARKEGAIKRAILTGADDVIIKPVSPGTLIDRITHITKNRPPFIVVNDYLGPERRRAEDPRPSQLKPLRVVNTLKAKTEGQRMGLAELSRAVKDNMKEVMSARLDYHGLKLSWVCDNVLKAYKEKRIDKELRERLIILVGVLEDAARTALDLREPDLSKKCTQMARQVEEMAERYENPTAAQLSTVEKLREAFELAKTAKAGPSSGGAQ